MKVLGLEREGATIFELNCDGTNMWSAHVQPGFDDEGNRLTSLDTAKIAAHFQRLDEHNALLRKENEALQKQVSSLKKALVKLGLEQNKEPSNDGEIGRLTRKLEAVYNAGINGIAHVGRANYREREEEAIGWVSDAMELTE